MGYEKIRLLIFLDDIWNRIIDNGFRESSHLTRKELITWDEIFVSFNNDTLY